MCPHLIDNRCTRFGFPQSAAICAWCRAEEARRQAGCGPCAPVAYTPAERAQAAARRAADVPKRLLLTAWQSPGDVVMLTAALRDLHRAYPGRFQTDVRTSCSEIWQHNPHVTPLLPPGTPGDPLGEFAARVRDAAPAILGNLHRPDMNVDWYPPDWQAEVRRAGAAVPRRLGDILYIPCTYHIDSFHHFSGAFHRTLGRALGLDIPQTALHGELPLSDAERGWISQVQEMGVRQPYWVIACDGKWDFTAKWPDFEALQEVVHHFMGRILFVQTGMAGNYNPRLSNVIDLVGQTDMRQLIRLLYHASGALCTVNGVMHMLSALPPKPGGPAQRGGVVLCGGREHATWEHYPWHRFLSTQGALPCCAPSACWASRCTPAGDGDEKDLPEHLCPNYIERPPLTPHGANRPLPTVRIPRCLAMISPAQIIAAIEGYYQGGLLSWSTD